MAKAKLSPLASAVLVVVNSVTVSEVITAYKLASDSEGKATDTFRAYIGFPNASPEKMEEKWVATVCIDAYLTDSVKTSYGVSRGYPAPLSPEESEFDAVLATHSHDDHQDPEAIIPFSKHAKTRYIGPFNVIKLARAGGFYGERSVLINRGEVVEVGDIKIEAVYARHMFEPEPTPDATGYLITVGKWRIYHSGDTEYDARIVDDTENRTDISLICINGITGNMDTKEAAFLAWRQGCQVAVPMHFGLWNEDEEFNKTATLDLSEFTDTYKLLEPTGRVWIPVLGEPLELK